MKKIVTIAIASLAAGGILFAGAGQASAQYDSYPAGDGASQADCDGYAARMNRLDRIATDAGMSGDWTAYYAAQDGVDQVEAQAIAAGCVIMDGRMSDAAGVRPEFHGGTTVTGETAVTKTSPRNSYTPIGGVRSGN